MNEDDLRELVQEIANDGLLNGPVDLTLKEFRRFYEYFIEINERRVPRVIAIHLGDHIQIVFPDHSRQEIIIAPDDKRSIVREDLNFITIIDWKGAKGPETSFIRFLVDEIRISKWRIGLMFFTSLVLIIVGSPSPSNLDLINSLLIQASTVFLSIYLIFTVSQSERLSSDRKLFERGTFHKYYSDDKHITSFAILTIALAFINTLIVHWTWFVQRSGTNFTETGRWVIGITTSIVVVMLFHTFFIVGDYYLERTRDIAERQHLGSIFHDEYMKSRKTDDLEG